MKQSFHRVELKGEKENVRNKDSCEKTRYGARASKLPIEMSIEIKLYLTHIIDHLIVAYLVAWP